MGQRIRQRCRGPTSLPTWILVFPAAKEHIRQLIVQVVVLERTMASSIRESLLLGTGGEASAAPNECSIALLPLRNLSSDPRDEPLCAGITGDIIHNLTRFRDLTVIAQHSALRIVALALAPREIAERLGIRYLLMGDLKRRERELEVQTRLLEAESEQVIWSMKFDGPLGDVFAFQDEATEIIASNLAVEIRAAELRRAVDSAPSELSAYGLILRGEFLIHRYQRAANLRARFLFERPGGWIRATVETMPRCRAPSIWTGATPGQRNRRRLSIRRWIWPSWRSNTTPSMPAATPSWATLTCMASSTRRL
jgi:TolB-like protein